MTSLQVYMHNGQRIGPLEVWPIRWEGMGPSHQSPIPSAGLDALHFSEFEDEEGPVIELIKVTNPTEQTLFIPEGWIVGGRLSQMRTFDYSVGIPPQETICANVTCVEQGRWEPADARLDGGRAPLHVRSAGWKFDEGKGIWKVDVSLRQPKVWMHIHELEKRTGIRPTHSLEQIMREDSFRRGFPKTIQDLAQGRLKMFKGQNGAVICFDGKPLVMEAFNAPVHLRRLLLQTIRGISFDVPHLRFKATTRDRVENFLQKFRIRDLQTDSSFNGLNQATGGTTKFESRISYNKNGDCSQLLLLDRNHSPALILSQTERITSF